MQAYTFSEGKAIFASGSPFPAFEGFGKRFESGHLGTWYLVLGTANNCQGACGTGTCTDSTLIVTDD